MPKGPDPLAINQALRQAAAALQGGRHGEAEQFARKALAMAPREPGALQLHGMTLLALDRHQDAIKPLREAAGLNPSAPPETYLAAALRGVGKPDEAIGFLRSAVRRKPPFAHAFYELGATLHAQRQLEEAAAILREGQALAPNVPAFPLALGQVLFDQGDHANAQAAFERALQIAPNFPPALEGLGGVLMSRGFFEAAAAQFGQLVTADPRKVKAQFLLSSCLLELGRKDEAIAILRAVVTAHPELFGQALKAQVETGQGRMWLKPSAAAKAIGLRAR